VPQCAIAAAPECAAMRFRSLVAGLLISVAFGARADFIDLYANPLDIPQNKAPAKGHSNVLLIPVQIDFGSYQPVDMDRLHQFFEGAYTSDLTFSRYYELASANRFHPAVTVAPLVEYTGCPAMLHSAGCTIDRGNVAALSQGMDFIRDVFRRAHDEGKVDFSKFDANGVNGAPDGVIDGVMIVVNVPGVGIAFPIEYVNSGGNLAGGTGGPLLLDGVKIPYAAIGGASFAGGAQHLEYVILHEFGHLLGFADLYYEHPMAGDKWPSWEGLHFSLMGDYDYTAAVPLPDAESRRALGWQPHQLVSGTQTLTLLPAGEGGVAVKLGMMDSKRHEYFLAEVRGPAQGVDTGLVDSKGAPTWGLALYHVDWSRGPKPDTGEWPGRLLYCLDCDPYHPFVRNLESSGTFGLVTQGAADAASRGPSAGGLVSDDQVLFEGGAIGSLPVAQPLTETNHYVATNYYDGSASGITIRDIKVNADHSVTATFTAPAVADPCSDVTCGSMEQCTQSGAMAGNCEAVLEAIPDAGVLTTPPASTSGCNSSSAPGFTGVALILGLALASLRLRRRA
jgi:M6 family metalloprotease-like protein